MRAALRDAAVVKHDDKVGHACQGDAVRDEDRNSSAASDPPRGLKIAHEQGRVSTTGSRSGGRLV